MATLISSSQETAISRALPGAGDQQAQLPSLGANLHVLGSLRRHRRVALWTAATILLLGIPAAWFLGRPKYAATAVIYVSPRFLSNVADSSAQRFDSTAQYREYVQQNVKTINRFDILEEALQKLGPQQPIWLKPGESIDRATTRLQGALVIEQVPDTYQITITLDGHRRNGLAEIVNSVAHTYLEKAKAEEFFGSNERVETLMGDRLRLQKEIAEKQARRMALAQELGVSSFTDNDLNPYDRLLVTAKEAQSEAQKDAIQAETELAVFDEKQHPGGSDSLHAFALTEANKDPALGALMSSLDVRRAQVLASLSGLSPDHPGRRAAERELADIEKERDAEQNRAVGAFSKMLLDQRAAHAYQARQVEQQLTAEVERQASQAAWFTHGYQEGIQLGLDVEEARKAADSLQQRIDYFSLEKNAPGFVRLFSSARTPDQPVKGGRKLFLAAFVALAGFMALALPVGIDLLDPRLHSPHELETLLGFPLTAWFMERDQAEPDFAHQQILRFANRLLQEKQNNHSRIFSVTSVKAGGGTSTIVLNTAKALNSLGVSALAVEANSYNSDPRYAKPDSRGVIALLRSKRHLLTEVVPSDEHSPDRVPVGEVAQHTSLPEIKHLEDLLRDASTAYDIVLVDAPPILVSVDAEILACLADVVVLISESASVTKEELRRAAKILERLNVRAIASVLNRVRRDEPSGLAAVAAEEFQKGAITPPANFRPWLWK